MMCRMQRLNLSVNVLFTHQRNYTAFKAMSNVCVMIHENRTDPLANHHQGERSNTLQKTINNL